MQVISMTKAVWRRIHIEMYWTNRYLILVSAPSVLVADLPVAPLGVTP